MIYVVIPLAVAAIIVVGVMERRKRGSQRVAKPTLSSVRAGLESDSAALQSDRQAIESDLNRVLGDFQNALDETLDRRTRTYRPHRGRVKR